MSDGSTGPLLPNPLSSGTLHVTKRDDSADMVYETEPMKKTQAFDARNQPLDMSPVDNTRRSELGVSYDELMARSVSARKGQVVEHTEAMARLRAARA